MRIGFGQADITPRGGLVSLTGQFEKRITDQVHDPLRAVAMVVQTDGARTIWVSADNLKIFAHNVRALAERVRRFLPDLREEELVVSATHIHTGPSLYANSFLALTGRRGEPEEALSAAECEAQFADRAAEAVREALENLREARIDYAIARIQTGVCRRTLFQDGTAQMYGDPYRPDFFKMECRDGGPSQFLYVSDADGRLMGVVANVPCTAQCDEHALYMTADYWGVVRERLERELGDQVRVLPLCRCAGSTSPHQLVDRIPVERDAGLYSGRACAEWMGEWVAENILSHRRRVCVRYEGDALHRQGMKTVDFPIWPVTEEEYRAAVAYLADKGNYTGDGKPLNAYAHSNAFTRKERFESGRKIYPANIYATVLGGLLFITNPFELYVEYADRIRMALRDSIVIDVELTHDGMGYLATPNAVAAGHYSANIFNGVCAPDGGEVLVRESVALARSLLDS